MQFSFFLYCGQGLLLDLGANTTYWSCELAQGLERNWWVCANGVHDVRGRRAYLVKGKSKGRILL